MPSDKSVELHARVRDSNRPFAQRGLTESNKRNPLLCQAGAIFILPACGVYRTWQSSNCNLTGRQLAFLNVPAPSIGLVMWGVPSSVNTDTFCL